mmetsp:Transcript_26724/g.38202  ORF Transcript_26724/g.38202 Transcript_26724/m.38202 type:complete len:124 (+) Transcript_26724:174-545(+)|eukprot:CAMPEP_0170077838 /NCGR_PEP_ID=MMETSP0019_2-20121128/14563_1 /TAXON_ID=98059 /ORGANISM="Dinobryon sp., Strain UTEXLB2267" /LENGTH=123 /DNA_ID=CAMNT_0010290383 /DNA_START=751 /DNA_END=1122 /DNA_ORIENTATION=-
MKREVESVGPEAVRANGPENVAMEFLFDSLSSPEHTTLTAGEAASVTVAYDVDDVDSNSNYAISTIELHRSRLSQWQVEILHLPDCLFRIVLGIIGKKEPELSSLSYHDTTSFGWVGTDSDVY